MRNRAVVPKYDYTLIKTNSSACISGMWMKVSHCTRCLATFTAVSGSIENADKIIKRKFRNHVKDQTCDEKAHRLAEQIPDWEEPIQPQQERPALRVVRSTASRPSQSSGRS